MQNNKRGIGTTGAIVAVVAVVALAAGIFLFTTGKPEAAKFETPYQAVLLTNGAVYYGKLEGYGTRFPVLRDVYYVQSATNPDTKQVTNVLIKRGKELHGPDRMYLTPSQIVLVEPVGTSSKVAQLISEDKSKAQ